MKKSCEYLVKSSIILVLFIFLFVSILAFVSAEIQSLPSQKLETCTNLPQTCSSCSYVNLSSVKMPDSSTISFNVAMEKNGANYNYTFCNNSQTGNYIVTTCGDKDGTFQCANYDYEVTATGKTFSTEKAITYILVWIVGMIILVGLVILGLALPSKNETDQMTGYVIAVNNLKYFKILCLVFAYLVAMFMAYFSWMVSFAYLDMQFISTIFQFLFYAEAVALLPLFIVGTYVFIANWVRDTKVHEALLRGFKIR